MRQPFTKNAFSLLYLAVLLVPGLLPAQSIDYAHGWYTQDTSRTFVKLKIAEAGLYRLPIQDLIQAG
ncbi:MAG: hypothetical protein AAFP92_32795, partial [Bacteroidota bacterium]